MYNNNLIIVFVSIKSNLRIYSRLVYTFYNHTVLVAQLVEHKAENLGVVGSSPT